MFLCPTGVTDSKRPNTNFGTGAQQLQLTYIVYRNIKWYNHFGEISESNSIPRHWHKKDKNRHIKKMYTVMFIEAVLIIALKYK